MRRMVDLTFEVTVCCEEEEAKDLGGDLAVFLQESFFNGEDVFVVEFKGHKVK